MNLFHLEFTSPFKPSSRVVIYITNLPCSFIMDEIHESSQFLRIEHLPGGISQPRKMGFRRLFILGIRNLHHLTLCGHSMRVSLKGSIPLRRLEGLLVTPTSRRVIVAIRLLIDEASPVYKFINFVTISRESSIVKTHEIG